MFLWLPSRLSPIWALRATTDRDGDFLRASHLAPHFGREVPFSGAKVKRGEAFSLLRVLRVLREATQRATREGSNSPVSRGVGHLDGVSNPCTQSASEFLLYSVRLLQSPTRSPSADPGPTKRTRLERDFDRNRPGAPAACRR